MGVLSNDHLEGCFFPASKLVILYTKQVPNQNKLFIYRSINILSNQPQLEGSCPSRKLDLVQNTGSCTENWLPIKTNKTKPCPMTHYLGEQQKRCEKSEFVTSSCKAPRATAEDFHRLKMRTILNVLAQHDSTYEEDEVDPSMLK